MRLTCESSICSEWIRHAAFEIFAYRPSEAINELMFPPLPPLLLLVPPALLDDD